MTNTNIPFIPVGLAMHPSIQTVDGTYFDYHNPSASPIDIATIAHALSNICRFNGQCEQFYSVAQHAVSCSYLVPREHALAALMHDAAEAFVGDMPAPLKQLIPQFQQIERDVEAAIFAQFNIPLPLDASVKQADLIMLGTEQRDLLPPTKTPWTTLHGIPQRMLPISPLKPEHAKSLFLQRFHSLVTGTAEALPRCGDIVFFAPREEHYVVAWAEDGQISAFGWPNEITRSSDCITITRVSDDRHADWVNHGARLTDSRGKKIRRLYSHVLAPTPDNAR